MKKLTLFTLATCVMLLAGCASVPMTSPSMDSDAKKFQPEPGKASIYINRNGNIFGGAVVIETVLDGRIVGSLAPSTYQLLSVAPGEHVLMTSGRFENVEEEKVNVKQGENYFFSVSLSMGWVLPHVNLKQIEDAAGRDKVTASERADAAAY